MARVLPSSISPGISALADAIAGYGANKAAANMRQAQMDNMWRDDERAQKTLDIQQGQADLAQKRFEWEQFNHKLTEDRAAAKFPLEQEGLELGNQKAGVDLATAQTAQELEDTRISSLFPTANTMTDAVVGNVERKMPEFDIGALLKQGGSGLPPVSNLPGAAEYDTGFDTGGYGGTAGMDDIQGRLDMRDQVGQLAYNEVLSNKDLDAPKWIEDQTKAFSGGGGYRPATPEEKAAFGVDPKAPLMMTPDGKPDMISGTTKPAPQVGTIPAGYELITDQQTGASRLQPIAGSEADLKAKQAQNQVTVRGQNSAVANDAISRALAQGYKVLDGDTWYNPAAGFGSGVANWVPGSNAVDFTEAIKPVNANNAFEQLAQMRAASANGGALGAVSEKELALLESARASLSNAQSEEQLRENMDYMWNLTQDAIHGWDAGPPRKPVGGQPWESPMKGLQQRQDGMPMGASQQPAAGAGQADQNFLEDSQVLLRDPSAEAIADFNSHYGQGAAERIIGAQ